MRSFRQITSAAIVTLGIFSAVTYTACSKTTADANAQFLGTYTANESCNPTVTGSGWTSAITASSAGANSIVISNFGGSSQSVTATVTSNGTLTIPTSTITSGTTVSTVSGSGSISNNTITIVYTLTNTSYSGTCTQTLIKQ